MYALWVLINFSEFIILKIFYDDNISWMIYFGSQSFTLHNLMEPEDLNYDKKSLIISVLWSALWGTKVI